MMKTIKLTTIAILVLAIGFAMNSCNDDDSTTKSVVTFAQESYSTTTEDYSPVTITLNLEPEASSSSTINVALTASGGEPGTAFTTSPSMSNGLIEVPVEKGASTATFTVTPQEEGIAYDNVEIEFEITEVGSGLKTEGLTGIYSSLLIENTKSTGRPLPFSEPFEECDEGGSGELPDGWKEIVALQNNVNTAHWNCSNRGGIQVNTFSGDGTSEDSSQVWLVSPRVGLVDASNPVLSFDADRRFETDIQEAKVFISTDYNGSNFNDATWEVFQPGVDFIESNDAGADDYESSGELDLSAYSGEVVSVAFAYYASGSKGGSHILRIDEVEIKEGS
jgi:hypothetical protein